MNRLLRVLLCVSFVFLCCHAALAESGHGDESFPALKDFHDVMAKIWHVHYPANDWAAVRADIPTLLAKMEALKKADLPEAYASRAEAFKKKLALLDQAVQALAELAKQEDNEKLKKAVFAMHEAFHGMIAALHGPAE